VSVTVRDLIDSALAEERLIGRPALRRWRGSMLGGCLRAQYYAAEKIPESNPPDARALRVFARGRAVADVLNHYIGQDERVEHYESEVWAELPAWNFAANVDGLIWWRDGSAPTALEFKSTHAKGMTWVAKEPKPEHAVQAAAGRLALERALDRRVACRLVYISSDDWRMTEHEIGEEWDGRALRVLAALHYFDRDGRRPPRLIRRREQFPCSWCSWLDLCRPECRL
jgi:hypothetical protein